MECLSYFCAEDTTDDKISLCVFHACKGALFVGYVNAPLGLTHFLEVHVYV